MRLVPSSAVDASRLLAALPDALPAGARNRPSLLMQQAQHEALLAMALAADRVEPGDAQQPQAPAQGGNQQQPGGAEVEGGRTAVDWYHQPGGQTLLWAMLLLTWLTAAGRPAANGLQQVTLG